MAMQGNSLESGLRQLLAMRGPERQAALAAMATNHPPATHQAAGLGGLRSGAGGAPGLGAAPSLWSDGGHWAGPAAGLGGPLSASASGLHQNPMKIPLPAGFYDPVQQEEMHAGPKFPKAHAVPQAPSQPVREEDRDHLVQSITNAMSRILVDSCPGQTVSGDTAACKDQLRRIEWLRGQLELQQEQSMRKISHLVDHGTPMAYASAAADQRQSPRAAQRQLAAGNRGPRPQEAGAGAAPQRAHRAPQVLPVPVHAVPGWDPRLALAAAEAAGGVPSRWAADAAAPSRAAWQRKQAQTPQRPSGEECTAQHAKMASDTLRSHLRALQEVDSRRVVQVRKISKLGFQSGAALESHYSAFGKVECVRVAFSHVKPQSTGLAVRIRPSGLGFVVMSSIEEAEKIIEAGENQVVNGVEVLVRPYEVRAASEKEPTNEDNNEDDLLVGA